MIGEIDIFREPDVDAPVMIEGLPGIGHVGRIAARHLASELGVKKFATLHLNSFSPHVLIKKSGLIQTMKNDFYYWKAQEEGQRDLIIVTGNTQSTTPEGQYNLTEKILDLGMKYGVQEIYTLGGLGIGRIVDKPKVYGAVTDRSYIPRLKEMDVIVERESVGQIIGISGLLLGIGKVRGIPGICLMGETSGYYLDPNSAQAVLDVLTRLLELEVDMTRLQKRAKATEMKVAEAQKMERKMMEDMGMVQREPSDDQMRYIG
ncbi:MAG: proteasome assembly chaperone family protein [Euryarchaeota archaeon]|nr:proteasome assembly chaperone family protein [Euryarchaeota archaeon]